MATESPASGTTTFRIPLVLPSPARCTECVERLCAAVNEMRGVLSAECDTRSASMTVVYDSSAVTPSELERRVVDLGLQVSGGVEHASYRVTGLD